MIERFCQDCGAAAVPAARFCATCGAQLAAPPEEPGAPVVTGAAPTATPLWASSQPGGSDARGSAGPLAHAPAILVAAAAVAVVALLGGTVALDRLAGSPGGTGGSPVAPGASQAAGASSPPIPATLEPAASSPPTTPPSATPVAPAEPGASPPVVAAGTPVEAIAAFLGGRGLRFAGACSKADPLVDAGAYCTELVETRPGLEVHWIGLVGSEPDTWLLVAAGQFGWAVIEWAPVEAPASSPPF